MLTLFWISLSHPFTYNNYVPISPASFYWISKFNVFFCKSLFNLDGINLESDGIFILLLSEQVDESLV